MHISEGVLRPEILIAGAAISLCALAYSLKSLKNDDIPTVSAFSALFFLASFVHVPIGITSVHLILSGFVGAFLGVRAILAIFVALLLQALLFGFGGLSTLGVNLFVLSTPALLASLLFRIKAAKNWQKNLLWFGVGFLPISLGALLLSFVLCLNGDNFITAAKIAFIAHIPVMLIEGIITLFACRFLLYVKPSLFERSARA